MAHTTTVVNETSRRYVYGPGGDDLFFPNVLDLRVSESGNHYLRFKVEDVVRLAIVAPGWRAILINPGDRTDWTI